METLLKRLQEYRQKHLIEECTLGIMLMNDPHLLKDLGAGRKLRLRSLAKIEKIISRPPKAARK